MKSRTDLALLSVPPIADDSQAQGERRGGHSYQEITVSTMVVTVCIAVLAFASARSAFGQQTRDTAVKNMRQLDPKELDPSYNQTAPFAQKLVEAELAAHPRVILIGMHVTPPHHPTNVIIASNFGRIGKLADKDDMHVIDTGISNFDVEPAGKTFEAEIPLRDRSSHIIGAVSFVFNFQPGDDKDAFTREGKAMAAHMNAQIATVQRLFGPSK